MKPFYLSIIGIIIQLIGIGLMFYGIKNSPVITWIGFPLIFVGLTLVIISLKKSKADQQD